MDHHDDNKDGKIGLKELSRWVLNWSFYIVLPRDYDLLVLLKTLSIDFTSSVVLKRSFLSIYGRPLTCKALTKEYSVLVFHNLRELSKAKVLGVPYKFL